MPRPTRCPHGDPARYHLHQLRKLRQGSKLTQADLATLVGCSPGLISQLERGLACPSLQLATRLKEALHLDSIDALMEEDPPADERSHVYGGSYLFYLWPFLLAACA